MSNFNIKKRVAKDGNALTLTMGPLIVEVSRGIARIYRVDEAGARQLIKHANYSQDNGLRDGETFGRQFLKLRQREEQEQAARVARNAEAVKAENIIKNPKNALTAVRDGAQRAPAETKSDDSPTYEGIYANPKRALAEARGANIEEL